MVRLLTGAASSMVMPSEFNLIGRWIPVYESSTIVALSISGQQVRADYLVLEICYQYINHRLRQLMLLYLLTSL